MKKFIAILIAVLMLAAVTTAIVGAEDAVCVTANLDSVTKYNSSLVANTTGSVYISGGGLEIRTENKPYNLNGNPEDTEKYDPSKNSSRRHSLTAFDDGKVLPAGTYTVSIYVYENGQHLGDQLSHVSEIALTLHTADETDETLGYNHKTAKYMVKLFKANAADNSNSFAKSGVTEKVGNRTWGQYTATVTVSEPISQFAFWIKIDGESGENATYKTYVDNLSIYNEAGDPTPKPEADTSDTDAAAPDSEPSSDTQGTEQLPSASDTAKATDSATQASETESVSDTAAAEEELGCGASIGLGAMCVLATAGVAVVAVKKKKD